MRDAGDGAGDDQADAGAKTFEREQEISLANNSREMLDQSEHALERIDDGTYGICESCGNPIGKLRLQAFPRATLCSVMQAEAGAPLIPPPAGRVTDAVLPSPSTRPEPSGAISAIAVRRARRRRGHRLRRRPADQGAGRSRPCRRSSRGT